MTEVKRVKAEIKEILSDSINELHIIEQLLMLVGLKDSESFEVLKETKKELSEVFHIFNTNNFDQETLDSKFNLYSQKLNLLTILAKEGI